MKKIRIEKTPKGKSTFLEEAVDEGEVIMIVQGALTSMRDVFTIQIDSSHHIYPDDLYGRYINHSCEPNTLIDATMKVIAKRYLEEGVELTFDYSTTEDELVNEFDCLCGNINCRGKIVGKNKLN